MTKWIVEDKGIIATLDEISEEIDSKSPPMALVKFVVKRSNAYTEKLRNLTL